MRCKTGAERLPRTCAGGTVQSKPSTLIPGTEARASREWKAPFGMTMSGVSGHAACEGMPGSASGPGKQPGTLLGYIPYKVKRHSRDPPDLDEPRSPRSGEGSLLLCLLAALGMNGVPSSTTKARVARMIIGVSGHVVLLARIRRRAWTARIHSSQSQKT